MRKNIIKEKLKKGEILLGTWCILPSESSVNVLGASGLDFVIIDMEHGPISFETAEGMIRASEVEGCTPFIRVPKNDESDILRALDIGAYGVVVPHIENRADKEKALQSIKYFPIGNRGFSPFTRSAGYSPSDLTLHTKKANEETMSIFIVEGKNGLENLDSIIEDKDIDVIYLGLCDISQSIGLPGQITHPKVKDAVLRAVAKVREKGISVGAFTDNQEQLKWFKEIGIQFITYSLEVTELFRIFKKIIQDFKGV
ncbi:hypothetical protein A2230_08275 [candidate division WOR-1 bacterium RIFOXYA2_FULL_36_21]|uniref:HpcH/HpaI aldolase/citrate lyase domain-containing protein n=1 Tax=candidate division WOR-1 bacterium RIFOXYB2_FULL_36_35 TaxID=1802578 RepID=A0A1F4S8H6_UNCSA|nr:MAG: hypothetical protein A2230_08275 [candidate division WOR-1 bacterium RIFOXYA2_FULL_36_21]OGC16687.1 MAG: hypothetical protein A2290_03490 [candidate division WOR-1 bacterium RIFOXYB2_FULL_36_35]OGC16978.1 MAG: hypothetical protein A2282_02480 [candidate division WOR-1 bacterium RIFOXYA12_FULL_36_13]